MFQQGKRTHLAIGSANATDAALIRAANVEVLAELSGRTDKVGSVQKLLDHKAEGSLGQYLVRWSPSVASVADTAAGENQKRLEAARQAILQSRLFLSCQPDGEHWSLQLSSEQPVEISGIKSVRVWPVTVDANKAVDASMLSPTAVIAMPVHAISSLTSLIAFRLETGGDR